MRDYTPYEIIYMYDKMQNPDLPLVENPVKGLTLDEWASVAFEGTPLDPEVFPTKPDPRLRKSNEFIMFEDRLDPAKVPPSWQTTPPYLPEATGSPYDDARNEFNLIKTLNAPGNARARKRFTNVQRYLNGKLSQE